MTQSQRGACFVPVVRRCEPSKMFAEAKRSLTNFSMLSKMIVEATGAFDQFDSIR